MRFNKPIHFVVLTALVTVFTAVTVSDAYAGGRRGGKGAGASRAVQSGRVKAANPAQNPNSVMVDERGASSNVKFY